MLVEAERMDDALSDQEALGDLVRTHLPKPSWPPLFIEPATETLLDHAAFIDWLVEKRPVLDRLIVNHGGIVLRRFPVRATEEFEAVIDVFPAFEQGYVGGITPRKVLGKKALESTALSSHYRINLHQEMAYAPDYPARIMFFAKVIPEEGGQTTIADMRRLTASLPDDLRSLFEERGYSSVRNYGAPGNTGRTDLEPDFLPWSQSFGSEDRGEVERRCGELGRRAIWNENGSLTTVVEMPAFTTHPQTGERIYRNNLHAPVSAHVDPSPEAAAQRAFQARPSGNYVADGESLSDVDRQRLIALVDSVTLEWPWTAGDVMILDNLLVAHGRNPFKGERETQVALLG